MSCDRHYGLDYRKGDNSGMTMSTGWITTDQSRGLGIKHSNMVYNSDVHCVSKCTIMVMGNPTIAEGDREVYLKKKCLAETLIKSV